MQMSTIQLLKYHNSTSIPEPCYAKSLLESLQVVHSHGGSGVVYYAEVRVGGSQNVSSVFRGCLLAGSQCKGGAEGQGRGPSRGNNGQSGHARRDGDGQGR